MEFNRNQIFDIERSIIASQKSKSQITIRKKGIENELAEITNKIRSNGKHLPQLQYKSYCKKQDSLKNEILEIETTLSELNEEISKKHTLKEEIKHELSSKAKAELPSNLIELKDYYINFAADRTRVGSMRAMAAEFAEKLEIVIKNLAV